MSFLEISLLYGYEKPAAIAEDLPFAKRKVILKSNLILIFLSALIYMYFSGEIVSDNLQNIRLSKQYQNESMELTKVKSSLVEANRPITIEYLAGQGYRENKNLSIIRRNNNVAENTEFNYYQ